MKKILLLIIFATCCVVNGQNNACTAVNGGPGKCIPILECKPLLDEVKKNKNRDILKRSHCGFIKQSPAVCCPNDVTQCSTPEDKPGQCIEMNSCPSIRELLKKKSKSTVVQRYLNDSQCICPDENCVCCGPIPNNIKNTYCSAVTAAQLPNPSTGCCGVSATAKSKIYGGTATAVDEHPWTVILEHKTDQRPICGGALISDRYVLTAAHCVAGRLTTVGRPTHVRLGEYDITHDGPDCAAVEGGGQDCTDGIIKIPIEQIIPHCDYNPRDKLKRDDIALIRMMRAAPFTDFIRPICLPGEDMTLRTTPFSLRAVGWGADSKNHLSPIKLQVELPYIPREECAPNTTIGHLWEGQFCAGGERNKDSCRGDSGGPLIYEKDGRYELIGIISSGGNPCGGQYIYGVYTNVFKYITWIRRHIE